MRSTGRMILVSLSAICFLVGISRAWPSAEASEPKPPTVKKEIIFSRDVLPILTQHCFPCHGPDEGARVNTLRLDLFEVATGDRGGYYAIVPGDPDASLALLRASTSNLEMRMPPADSSIAPLNEEEIEVLRAWIASGAEYGVHWSYKPPVLPELPPVKQSGWTKNGIDYFVLNRLEEEGLKPNAEADKTTLIRRAYLTLIGLPPTAEEVEAFLADESGDAYEQVVDGLLANPRYGEHQARYWLDAVRYGDTHGLHLDNERSIWPYRDWVVRALNDDLPFDDFTVWQLAGDLLPAPTTDQMIATGYVRMNPTTNEGGVIVAEFQAKNTFDRIETTATVFLGMTLTCARCHDHKYDPITQEDYYRMFAFFNSTSDAVMDGNSLLPEPVMKAPTPEQDLRVKRLERFKKFFAGRADIDSAREWAADLATKQPRFSGWETTAAFAAKDFDEAYDKDFGPEPGGEDVETEWKEFEYKLGETKATIIGKDNAAVYLRTTIDVPISQEISLSLGSDDAIKVWIDDKLVHQNKAQRGVAPNQDSATTTVEAGTHTLLVKIVNAGGADGVYFNSGSPTIERAVALSEKELSEEETLLLNGLYLTGGPDSKDAELYRGYDADLTRLNDSLPSTYVAKEMDKPREAFVLRRGEYDQPLQKVERGIPVKFGSLPTGTKADRLALAHWLTDPKNPLVSRVFVNRVWQRHFGTGIVLTSEDFGSRGEWPTHPELLDYLATSFIDNGWSMKALHRQIVTSATFRQSAVVSPEAAESDPLNRLFSHGPRFRLDAEVIRDQALYLSGLLVEKMGGKGVNPYQPEGLWEAVGYTRSNTANYMQDTGDALYRRSIYTFWKRTAPPATMAIFDAPTREACVVRRSRTNTPMQALAVMNDPQFVEASRKLAELVMASSDDNRERAAWLFKKVTSRKPTSVELDLVGKAYERQKAHFANDADGVEGLLTTGESPFDESLDRIELAAWSMVCNLVLNLDEVLTQH
ncbi:MAG: DUF1553 domain-containing protein [Armatimonadetes bacterium]|nr:DUF1553 domain-containing protein [Armatimonadota bacterium]